jgi:hypothetical protein
MLPDSNWPKVLTHPADNTWEEKYRMSLFRVALLTTAVVLVLPPSQAKADDSVEAQFLGGTVKTIPADSFGALNMKDTNELRFQYGTSVYRLPYARITETEITQSNNKGHWLVHMPGRKRTETLVISYHDANGAANTLNFLINSRVVESAEQAITTRRTALEAASADPASFWGDLVWKTPRTAALWEQQQQQRAITAASAAAAAGTK